MGFIENQQRVGSTARLAQFAQKSFSGQYHTAIGQRRLGEHTGEFTRRQFGFDCLDVIELNHVGELRQVIHLSK